MIRFALPLDPDTWDRLDLVCPVVVCDHCGEFIDKNRPGNVLWSPDKPEQRHAHQACDQAFGDVPFSRDIGEWLGQLVGNYEHPLQRPEGVELRHENGDTYLVTRWELEGDPRPLVESEFVDLSDDDFIDFI